MNSLSVDILACVIAYTCVRSVLGLTILYSCTVFDLPADSDDCWSVELYSISTTERAVPFYSTRFLLLLNMRVP